MSVKTVVTIVTGSVVVESVDASLDDPIIERSVYDWKKGSLGTTLEVALTSFQDDFRLIFSDDFCHVFGFEIDGKHANDRVYIKKQAENYLPEDLSVVNWDYAVTNHSSGKSRVQVFALSQLIFEELENVSNAIKARIELVLPCSLALVESVEEKDESYLMIYTDSINNVISVVQDGIVKFVTTFKKEELSKKVVKTLSYTSDYLSFVPQRVIISGDVSKNVTDEFSKNFQVVSAEISAPANLVEIERITGADQKVLNISFTQQKGSLSKVEEDILYQETSQGGSNSIFVLIIIIFALLGLVLGYFVVSSILT